MKITVAKAISVLMLEKKLKIDFIIPSNLDVNTCIHIVIEVAKAAVEKKFTLKDNIDVEVRENIHSFFITKNLKNVEICLTLLLI